MEDCEEDPKEGCLILAGETYWPGHVPDYVKITSRRPRVIAPTLGVPRAHRDPPPGIFEELAAGLTKTAACIKYGCSHWTLDAWIEARRGGDEGGRDGGGD